MLSIDSRGLSSAEAKSRRAHFGTNAVLATPPAGWGDLARDTARDPMIWFLLATAALFALLGDVVEALTLAIALVPLVGMDLYLHRRTQASTQGLSSRLAHDATVVRDGVQTRIPAIDLVPGDRVLLSSGEALPADGLWLEVDQAQLDESALTGESYPVRKQPCPETVFGRPGAIEDVHWGLAGTRLLTGQGVLGVAYTGQETLYGQIVRSASRGAHARTPLQLAIANLVAVLLVAAGILCLILAWIRWQQGFGVLDAVLSAVTLAVAALPEEFPVVFTFFLGVGVYRLARRQALVRRAVAVENIGRVTCICSDKTGTLTEGRLRLTHRYPATAIEAQRLQDLAALASRADSGDPLDTALWEHAPETLRALRRVETWPFTEDRKRESALFEQRDQRLLAVVKGAPETLLPMCTLPDQERAGWQQSVDQLAEAGHKVIACAWRTCEPEAWAGGEPARNFSFAGLLAFEDPVRAGVRESVQRCLRAGIHVIMVTGDHPRTAYAVARELGLGGGAPQVVNADVLESRLAQDGDFVRRVDVIARAVPAQKLGLVRRLQAAGETVAVTGDGVNDVPALQAADIGIAMGERGTRSAKDVAAVVLLDDNFRTIVSAIAEGFQLFRNLRMSFAYLLMIHIPLVVTAALIPLAGYPLLYLPVHIVWLELIIHPTALLVFQNRTASDRLPRAQRRRGVRFFDRTDWLIIAVVGMFITSVIAGGYMRSLGIGREVEHARAMGLVALTVASATVTLGLAGVRARAGRILAATTVVSSVLLVQTPFLADALHVTPLHLDDWLIGALGGVLAAVLAAAIRWRGRAD